MAKDLYKVKLNWFGEVHTFWTHAFSKHAAFLNACHQLSEMVGYKRAVCKRHCSVGDRKEVRLMEKE
jgi:hypothetical protein